MTVHDDELVDAAVGLNKLSLLLKFFERIHGQRHAVSQQRLFKRWYMTRFSLKLLACLKRSL